MKILYAPNAKLYLSELTEILYYRNYFGFRHLAKNYVDTLTKEMETTIHLKRKRKVPLSFVRYGKGLWYVAYPKNKRTTWYFFFTYHPEGDIYFIRYITNNHVAGHLLG